MKKESHKKTSVRKVGTSSSPQRPPVRSTKKRADLEEKEVEVILMREDNIQYWPEGRKRRNNTYSLDKALDLLKHRAGVLLC